MLTIAYGARGGDLWGHAYVIIVWKKMLHYLHNFFQGKEITSFFFSVIEESAKTRLRNTWMFPYMKSQIVFNKKNSIQ